MRFLIALVSIVSFLLISPFAMAASTEVTTAPVSTETNMMPEMDSDGRMMDAMGMGLGVSTSGMYDPMMMRGKMMGMGMSMGYNNPWALFFPMVSMILVWILLVSIIFALWTWIKKHR